MGVEVHQVAWIFLDSYIDKEESPEFRKTISLRCHKLQDCRSNGAGRRRNITEICAYVHVSEGTTEDLIIPNEKDEKIEYNVIEENEMRRCQPLILVHDAGEEHGQMRTW
ncbi:hypothetical protein RB195_006934 [Necator americanus]|uniref:Uncharacterized protein n=1 Tax=Necator americanus TaxID=51031 RepID=A0ABR1BY43_NECAM